MKRTDRARLAFKREAVPNCLLSRGVVIAWGDPDFDFESGRFGLFSAIATRGAA